MAENEQRNKDAMERFYAEVVGRGNVDVIDAMLSEDFTEHEEFPGIEPSREGVKQFFTLFRTAFPDASMTPEHMIADGDLVAAHVRIRGTHQGEFLGVPPTGKQIDVPAVDIVQFREDGIATAHWGVTDAMMMMQQLGAIPGPG
jgi:steroid delta-isomerase-like uncharacterized protein